MKCCGPGYASPAEAMQAPREKLPYTIAIYTGTGIQEPDYLCTIDADSDSYTYGQVISRPEMPGVGDELHHTGWNACSTCHGDAGMERKYMIVPACGPPSCISSTAPAPRVSTCPMAANMAAASPVPPG